MIFVTLSTCTSVDVAINRINQKKLLLVKILASGREKDQFSILAILFDQFCLDFLTIS